MISASLGTFFWLSAVYFYLKYSMELSPYTDVIFLMIIVIFMYFINVNIMQTKCGSSNNDVFKATLLPWVGMFGPMLVALYFFPDWKNPFSNTFGYIVARIAGGTSLLLNLLKPGSEVSLHYVYNDPSLLLNQFTPRNFETVLASLHSETEITEDKKAAFYKIVKLKDIISEWIWHLLTAMIVTSTSYTMLMNGECTKSADEYVLSHNIAMANTDEEVVDPTLYTITE